MEDLVFNSLKKEAQSTLEKNSPFTPSYQEARKLALSFFDGRKIPTKKDEDWIYTNIAKNLAPRIYSKEVYKKISNDLVLNKNEFILINNGYFNLEESKINPAIKVLAPHIETKYHDSFDALNLVSANGAVTFKVTKNCILKDLTIIHQIDENAINQMVSPRLHFIVEDQVELNIVEIFTSLQNDLFQYTTNAHTSFEIAKNSKVKHVKVVHEAKRATHIALTKATVDRDSHFKSLVVDLGIQTSRNNVEVHLNSENAVGELYGLYTTKNSEHSDNFTAIYHHSPNSFSDQLYKGILNHDSHSAFTGKIVIDQGADGVNSAQLNKNLLLSKKAHIDTRPQLLVSTDDVKCAHGATVGELSFDEEFYLTSRGIPKSKARQMLSMGFAHEVLLKIEDKNIFNFINKLLINNGWEA